MASGAVVGSVLGLGVQLYANAVRRRCCCTPPAQEIPGRQPPGFVHGAAPVKPDGGTRSTASLSAAVIAHAHCPRPAW